MAGYVVQTEKGFIKADGKGWLEVTPFKSQADVFDSKDEASLVARGFVREGEWRIVEVEVSFP